MKNKKLLITLFVIVCLIVVITLLFSCSQKDSEDVLPAEQINVDQLLTNIDTELKDSDIDASYNENNATKITFSDNNVNIDGLGANVLGTDVNVTSAGVYVLSGMSSDASVTVDCGKGNEVQLILDGLSITNADGPAFNIKSGKKITFTLAKDTINTIADATSYELVEGDTTIDGAIFSKSDLVFNGEGELNVNGNFAHAIVSKDTLTIAGGKYIINSKKVGICGKDCIKIAGADITVNAGSDALRSDNEVDANMGYIYIKDGTFSLTSVNDGIQAFSIVNIEGGTFDITTTSTMSTESSKAIKSGSALVISGGEFLINSEDDALHSNGNIAVSGGNFIISSGDDGAHADDTLQISGGKIVIKNSYEGLEGTHIIVTDGYIEINSSDDGLNASGGNDANAGVGGRPGDDNFGESNGGSIAISGGYIIIHNEGDGVDSNGSLEVSGGVVLVDGPSRGGNGSFDYTSTAKITGGVVITLGTRDMAQNFTEATQGSILVSSSGYFSAGTVMSLCDENGNVILAFTSTKAFNGALFSAPELQKGSTYTFYQNATVEGLDENGYAHNTTQTGGESCGTATLEDYIFGSGSGMGGGPGGGGRPGGRPW